jgi:hypothetical protein
LATAAAAEKTRDREEVEADQVRRCTPMLADKPLPSKALVAKDGEKYRVIR